MSDIETFVKVLLNYYFETHQDIIMMMYTEYSRTSLARTLMARLPWLFQTRSWVPQKNPIATDFGKFRVIFSFILKMVSCVYSLESPRWGDSNENTQHTFMLKKIKKRSLSLWRHALSSRWLWAFNHNTCENFLEEVQGAETSSLFPPPFFQDTWPCVQHVCAERNAPCRWNLASNKALPPASAGKWQSNDQTDLQC